MDNLPPTSQFRKSGDGPGDGGDSTGDGGDSAGDGGDSADDTGDAAPPVEPRERIPGGGAPATPPPDGDPSHRGGNPDGRFSQRGGDPSDGYSGQRGGTASGDGHLDTLAKAQDAPSDSGEGGDQNAPDSGEEVSEDQATMQRRARSKWLTIRLVDRMEEAVPESPVSYGSARSCCEVVEQTDDDFLQCTYCKQRWCVVCQRIRMGRAINDYAPILRGWGDVQFVSLTRPNVTAGELADEIGDMIKQLSLCRQQIRNTRGLELKTVRCTECTYNPERDDFNPHFHVAVNGKEQAEALVEEWLKRSSEAVRDAQDIRPWDGTDEGLLELVKYATKLFTPKGGELPGGGVQQEPMDAEALDTIFRALRNRHLLRGTGFNKEEARERAETEREVEQEGHVEDFDEEDLEQRVSAYKLVGEETDWHWEGHDWWNPEIGVPLSEFTPPDAGGGSESNV